MPDDRSWMTEEEKAVHDAQIDLQVERSKREAIENVLRVAWNALNRCECVSNKNALNFLRSKQHLWKNN